MIGAAAAELNRWIRAEVRLPRLPRAHGSPAAGRTAWGAAAAGASIVHPTMVARHALVSLLCTLVAAGLLAAQAGAANDLLRVSPDIPIVGKRSTIELELGSGQAPKSLSIDVVSPTNVRLKTRLERISSHLLRGTYHFSDDGLWVLRVRARGLDVYGEVLVLQNGALAPAPKGNRLDLDGVLSSNGPTVLPRFP